eukprot:g15285.t1
MFRKWRHSDPQEPRSLIIVQGSLPPRRRSMSELINDQPAENSGRMHLMSDEHNNFRCMDCGAPVSTLSTHRCQCFFMPNLISAMPLRPR